MDRRDFLSKMTALAGAAALPGLEPADLGPWRRLAWMLRRPAPVDDAAVDHLEQVTVALERLGPTRAGARAILGPAADHLGAIRRLLGGSMPAARRARLTSLAGEASGLVGWLRWDLDDHAGAAAAFRAGLRAAREAGDRPLAAYLAGSAACQPPHREDPRRRLDRLAALPWSEATPSTRAWLEAKAADAHALLGDAGACQRALDLAGRALEATGAGDGPRRPRFDTIDRAWLDGERGASLARLGRTAEARAYLEPALAALGPGGERDGLWLATALAGTYAADGEPEQACRVAVGVLERASRMEHGPVLEQVRALRRDLGRRGQARAARELDERLRQAAAAPEASRDPDHGWPPAPSCV